MLRIPLVDDYGLLLAPRWGELGLALQITLLALLGLLPLVLVSWLYRYELRLIRRLTALALLSLRLAVIALLWLLIAFQPMVARSTTEEQPGRVIVAVDRSASMDVPDPQRPVLDKLRLARALKLQTAAGAPTTTELDAWISRYEHSGPRIPPAWHDPLCRQVDQLTRTEVARRLLAPDGVQLLQALAARHEIKLIGFAGKTWDAPADRLDELFRPAPTAKAASRHHTDLDRPLARALEPPGSDAGRVLGVILLSDGQHNRGATPLKTAAALGERQVPIFPLALGARGTPPDIVLTEVRAPAHVFKGAQATVEARFRVSGLAAQDLKVELRRPGQPLLEEHVKTVPHDGTDRSYSVAIPVRMDRAGTEALQVSVRPVKATTQEISKENNRKEAVSRVAAGKARVLLLDGEVRWEYHYLASALLRDPAVALESVVFVQPRLGQVPEAELEKAGNPRLSLPVWKDKGQGDPLARYDCIFLGDVAPEQLPLAERRRLERYVADRGGTLIVLAGRRSMPVAFPGRLADGETDPLVKMLPIEKPEVVHPPVGFPVTLTAKGIITPFLQMDPAPEVSARRWAELPRHLWGVIGRAKPGADALAYIAADQLKTPDRKEMAERAQALIAAHNYGFGRVLYVGLDSTWRWRYKVGDRYHHRFWGQVVRWAASDQLLPAGNKYVRFGSREPVYRHGKPALVVARLEDAAGPLPPGMQAAARILREGAASREQPIVVPLTPAKAQPRLLQGQVPDLAEGRYRIELDIPHLGAKLKAPPEDKEDAGPRRDTFMVLPAESGEMFQLATNWPLLEALAARSHGAVLTPESASRLLDLLPGQVAHEEQRDEQRLWQDMPLVWCVLGLLLALLTLEWAGRKLAGLP
jgi:hypothetical protein